MVGFSLCEDGVALDQLLIPGSCPSPALAGADEDREEEKEVVSGLFFHRIPTAAAAAVSVSSHPVIPEFHQFFPAPSTKSRALQARDRSSVAPYDGGRPPCDRDADASPSCSANGATTRTELSGVLAWLRGAAIDPRNRMPVSDNEEWLEVQVLRARQTLFRTLDDATQKSELPLPPAPEKRQSAGRRSSEGSQKKNGGKGSSETLNQPKRRSERIAQNANENIRHLRTRRKRIGLGSNFQADVPDWKYSPSETAVYNYKEDPNTLKWLGFKNWPSEGYDRKASEEVVGQVKPNCCACSSPGSIVCIRSHVDEARIKLKDELGQAFFDWGFDGMGEEVSKSWTNEEQIRFAALNKIKDDSGYRSVWRTAPTYFGSRSKKDLISYYFNVYLLQQISHQSRLMPECINSDEDDNDNDENNEDAKKTKRDMIRKKAKLMRSNAQDFLDLNMLQREVLETAAGRWMVRRNYRIHKLNKLACLFRLLPLVDSIVLHKLDDGWLGGIVESTNSIK